MVVKAVKFLVIATSAIVISWVVYAARILGII